MTLPLSRRSPRPARTTALLLLLLAGCEEMQFGYRTPVGIPLDFQAGAPLAQDCLDRLAEADVRFTAHQSDARLQEARLGLSAHGSKNSDVRRRQTQWDQRYCVQRTNCLTLDRPAAPPTEVSDFFERCMDHRSQMNVRYNL